MTDFGSLSRAQIDALASVAFGGRGGGCSSKTLAALERRGLIRPVEHVDGNFRWKEWEMDVAVHIAFCEFCESVTA